jgi:hypothetical protein
MQHDFGRQVVIERRASHRRAVTVPGRIVWRDARGTTRFASIVTRDVNDAGAFVECLSGTPIPLYRLVHLQLDATSASCHDLPAILRQSKVPSAVYRVAPSEARTGRPEGYALRLLVDPHRRAAARPGLQPQVVMARAPEPTFTAIA